MPNDETPRAGATLGAGHDGDPAAETIVVLQDAQHGVTRRGREPSTPNSKLEWALAHAARGYRVFPAKLDKAPYIRRWEKSATRDPAQIRAWWRQWPDANPAVALGPSGMTAADIDVKNGKPGKETLFNLELTHGLLPVTRVVLTPSGGKHYHMAGETRSGTERLGPGFDVKSRGGYVLLPGSTTMEGTYSWSKNEEVLPPAPRWFVEKAGVARTRDRTRRADPPGGFDNLADIEWAKRWLAQEAPPAIEGDGGDTTTFNVACKLHDHGIAEETALDLMAEHYNDRCEPPWPDRDLATKIRNAYAYAIGEAGETSIAADFDAVAPSSRRFLNFDQILAMRPPEWLVNGWIPRGSIGSLYGPSGAWKSFMALHICLCTATGTECFGRATRRDDAFYIAAENPSGFRLRMWAWLAHHKVERADRFFLQRGPTMLNRPDEAEKLARDILAISPSPSLVVIDTLSANFDGRENTDEAAGFLRACQTVASLTGAAVLFIHHIGKDEARGMRGHYSLRANADFVLKMDRRERTATVVVEKAKDAPDGGVSHFTAESITVDPGAEFPDSLVLVPTAQLPDADFADSKHRELLKVASKMAGCMLKSLADNVSLFWDISDRQARRWIDEAFRVATSSSGVEFEGRRLWLESTDARNPKAARIVRMEAVPAVSAGAA